MAKIPGRLSRFHVSDDGGSTYTLVGCVTDMSMSVSGGEHNTTCHEDGQDSTFIAGKRDGTLDATLNWDETDAGQIMIRTAAYGTLDGLKGRWRQQEGSTFRQFTSDLIVTGYNPSGPNDDVATVDVSFRLASAITDTAQP